jgi:hypothetical protein
MIAQVSEDLVWNQIVARAWCDEDFMNRLFSDPRAVLAEHDLAVPAGSEVEVVIGPEVKIDDTDMVRRLVLPARPCQELFEEELVGDAVAYCYSYSGACGRCGYCGCRCACRCRC